MHDRLNMTSYVSNIAKVRSLASLTHGWNGYEAEPIPATVIDRAVHMLASLPSTSCVTEVEVFPTARESIQIEIEEDSRDYFEIEMFQDSVGIYFEKEARP